MYCFWRPKKFKLKSFKKPWRVIGVNSKGQGGRSNVQGVIGDYNVLGDRGNVRGVLSDGSLRSTAKAMGAVATSAVCLGLMMTPEGLFSFPAPLNGSFSLSAPPYDQFSFLAPLFGLFSFPAQPYRSMMALRDWWWLCENIFGLAEIPFGYTVFFSSIFVKPVIIKIYLVSWALCLLASNSEYALT